MANVVRILITAKDEISSDLDKIRDKATLLSKTDIGKGMMQGAGIAAFGMLKGAAMGALDAVTDFAAGSIAAAREEEVGIARLTASLKANVKGWDGSTAAIDKNIDAMVRTTGFSDDQMRDSLAKLVGATHDVDKAFALMATAQDLARFKGISLVEASSALIKVEGGQYRALKDLGIVLKAGATQTEALAAVQKVAGGQMAAYMETGAGKSEVLTNRLGDLQEELGQRLTPALEDATEMTLGFLDALDPDAPITLTDRLASLADIANTLNPAMWGMNITMGNLADAQAKAAEETKKAAEAQAKSLVDFRKGERAVSGVADAAAHVIPKMSTMRKVTQNTADSFKDLAKRATDAGDALAEAAYGPEELKLSFEANRRELARNIKESEELGRTIEKGMEKGKKPTREQRDRQLELQQAINDGKQEAIRLGTRLESVGGLSMADLRTELRKLGVNLDNLKGDAGDLWWYMNHIANVDLGTAYDNNRGRKGGKAAGGPIPPYGTSLVGEHGPELITTGSGGGMVNPSPYATPAGGGAASLTINVSTPVMTPGAAQALADAIAPTITRWQQARGL